MENSTKKITLATIKSFLKKNEGKIFVQASHKFNGMTDCVERTGDVFELATKAENNIKNTLGIEGAWFVGSSRDYLTAFEDDQFSGYKVSNACGSFYLAVKKEQPIVTQPKSEESSIEKTSFDAKTGGSFKAKIVGPSYAQRIEGDGYFIIANPDSKHVSFSKGNHDICFGDIVSDIIPDYTNEQYVRDYGDRMLGEGRGTVREYLRTNCRMAV